MKNIPYNLLKLLILKLQFLNIYTYETYEHWNFYTQFYLLTRFGELKLFRIRKQKGKVFHPRSSNIVKELNKITDRHCCKYCIGGSVVYFLLSLCAQKKKQEANEIKFLLMALGVIEFFVMGKVIEIKKEHHAMKKDIQRLEKWGEWNT